MNDAVPLNQAVTATISIPSFRPDAKTRRYDRQLRLWASSGQKSLESARVLLIGVDAAGCQSLKNLALPGISHFTILSADKVAASDISTNFFLLPESLGLNIAEEATRLLLELNPSVEGKAVLSSPSELLETDPEFYLSYSLIIGSNLNPAFEQNLSNLLWKASDNATSSPDIPLISLRTSGFVAKVRTQFREHCVVNTHPDRQYTLRIDHPFQEIRDYALGLDMDQMDSMEHSHVPYVVLLIRALDRWDKKHGKAPTYDDIEAFKEVLYEDRKALDEENFTEAEGQVFAATQVSNIPSSIESLMSDTATENISKESSNFWLLVRTLKEYVLDSEYRLLPLSAALPDMHTSTASYIQLQNLYKQKANQDLLRFQEILKNVLVEASLEGDVIEKEEVDEFVKHCHTLLVERGSQAKREFVADDLLDDFLTETFDLTHGSAIQLAFYLAEKHQIKTGSWPGTVEDEYFTVKAQLFEQARVVLGMSTLGDNADRDEDGKLLVKASQDEPEDDERMDESDSDSERRDETIKAKILQDSIDEVCRGGMGVLPTTAALVGGLVAQEGIKLITHQYGPLNGTCVIDLVKGGMTRYAI